MKYVFVHGLSGWGSYDAAYRRMPYWGMLGGDLIAWLRKKGYDAYAASVSPTGSAWDRACELYAQIAGVRTDYGEAHSREYRHERFGRDFSEKPLIPEWNRNTRLVLLGHSFGGNTIRLFSQLLADGDDDERRISMPELPSPLFRGGMEDRIHSIVTLASPMNGTTAYDLLEDPDFDPAGVRVPPLSKSLSQMLSLRTKPVTDGRDGRDYADYDMHIDHALEMNRRIRTLPNVYYFSVPCSFTTRQKDGTYQPKPGMEGLYIQRSCQIGAYTGHTRGGREIGEKWRRNDGLVNTISATAPSGAPRRALDPEQTEPGIWNVYPVYDGDHMSLQGGLLHKHDIREFYMEMLERIRELPEW